MGFDDPIGLGAAVQPAAARARQMRAELLDDVAEAYVEFAPELEERVQALRECVRGLAGRDTRILRLRYERSLSLDEIASKLKLSAVNVRVLLSRVRMGLRECIERKLRTDAHTF